LLHNLNQPLLHQHQYLITFNYLFFLFCHFINYISLYMRCPFGYLFARTSGNYRRVAYAFTTPYQNYWYPYPFCLNSKVYGAPSTELHYMDYYPPTVLNMSGCFIFTFYGPSTLVACFADILPDNTLGFSSICSCYSVVNDLSTVDSNILTDLFFLGKKLRWCILGKRHHDLVYLKIK